MRTTCRLVKRNSLSGHSVSIQPVVPRWPPPIFMKLCENVVHWPKWTPIKKKIHTPYGFWVMASQSLLRILLFSSSELRKCTFMIFSNFKRLYFDNGNEYRAENWFATLFLATELESVTKKSYLFYFSSYMASK